MPTKNGNGGNGQEAYDPNTGRYVSESAKAGKLFGVNDPGITEIEYDTKKSAKHIDKSEVSDYLSNNPNANKDFVEKAYDAIKEYEKIEPAVTKDVVDIVENLGGMAIGLDNRMKSLSSAVARMDKGAAGRENPNADKAIYGVKDILRYTACFKDSEFENNVEKMADELSKKYNLARVLNTMEKGSLYKGINCLFTDNNGHVFEMQFHTPESLHAKDGIVVDIDDKKLYKDNNVKTSHDYYEKIREVKTRAKQGAASTQEILESIGNNKNLYELWKNVPNHPRVLLGRMYKRGK